MASASKESGSGWSVRALLAGAVGAMIVSAPIVARAANSELADAIKAVTGDTGPQTQWTGPTTGPKAPPGKNIVFVSCGGLQPDLRQRRQIGGGSQQQDWLESHNH